MKRGEGAGGEGEWKWVGGGDLPLAPLCPLHPYLSPSPPTLVQPVLVLVVSDISFFSSFSDVLFSLLFSCFLHLLLSPHASFIFSLDCNSFPPWFQFVLINFLRSSPFTALCYFLYILCNRTINKKSQIRL